MIQDDVRAITGFAATLLLANFLLNDLPHAAGLLGNPNSEPPTPRQLRYISVLCQQLKITIAYEEQVKTGGEAGRMIRELEAEKAHRKRLKGGNPELPEVVITEIEGNITAHIPGVRAVAELSKLDQYGVTLYGLGPSNWLWFNRLINQSGIPRVGTLLLDEVLRYCGEKDYSIVNQVSAYGAVSQRELEDWYIRKGFTPVDYKKHGNTLLKWTPHSSSFRLERTTVDKIIDDLEHTWHRIESDMDPKMQSALGILKEVMGYYYEEPCVAVWDNNDLVGIAVYETIDDKNLGIRDTHIKEMASFTYEPGVGRLLVEEIIRIGREENSDIVSASYAPGARGFYENLGFVQNTYYLEPSLMMYKLKSSSAQYGTCYEDAWHFLIKEEEGYLVHGSVQLAAEGPRVNHAWVELPTGYIWEPQTGSYFTVENFKIMSPIEEHRYTVEEAAIMLARVGKHGPWTDGERMEYLGR